MLQKLAKYGVVGLAVVAISSLATWQLLGQDLRRHAENVPLTYTLSSWTSRSLEPGENESEERYQVGVRRADGSTARVRYERAKDGNPFEVRLISDLPRGRSVLVDTFLKSVTTAVLAEEQVHGLRNRPPCDGETVAKVLGYDVIRRTSSLPMDGHQLRVETLIAPELGCLVMEKRTIVTYRDGTERTSTLHRVVHIQIGEPADTWFDVPSDFTEVSPIERLRALQGPNVNVSNDQFALGFERVYHERRPR